MTEIKPYVHGDDDSPDRSVAVLLLATEHDDPALPGWLQPCGGASLLHRALLLLDRLDEADEKLFWSDDAAVLEQFERAALPTIRSLAGPPAHALGRGTPGRPASRFLLRFDGRCPFLRASTLDEAIRLIRVRFDIGAIVSCVRLQGTLFEISGAPLTLSLPEAQPMLRACRAFELAPLEQTTAAEPEWRHVAGASPFEIGASEAFRVDSPFAFDLAAAYLGSRRAPG